MIDMVTDFRYELGGIYIPLSDEQKRVIATFGDKIQVKLQKPIKHRTTGRYSQNNKVYQLATEIASSTGMDYNEIVIIAKYKAIKRGYPVKKDADGNVILNRVTGKPEPESQTMITTVECSYLIDELEFIKAEYC